MATTMGSTQVSPRWLGLVLLMGCCGYTSVIRKAALTYSQSPSSSRPSGRLSAKNRESGQARAPAYLVEGNDAERQVLLAEGSQLDGELIERRDDGRRGVDDLGWGRKEEASVETT
jgi:hypothetical protein